ncbi:winged helix-turn-helix transcriptional regulator [bacterium]|nr:winged helix-turn-helix transcriptional regulator [bacterium]
MNFKQANKLAEFLNGLSSETRGKILYFVGDKEYSVNEICDGIDEKQSYVSQQLRILYEKEYLIKKKIGTKVLYRVKNKKILDILNDIADYVVSENK